mmetsp:Transcript_162841/g.517356  ORF Transcript_162841/g.517356 Transcript_162841/m.517356 type:complete len:368 (-) Transcript_162841:328-1431(-)
MPLLLVSALLLLLGLPGAAVAAAPRPDRAHGGASVGNATERRLACIQRAEVEIARAPDKDAWRVTTTHAFKRDVAHFFCAREPEKQVVLELGIFKGHSTAVLASIFAKVISVDVSPEYTHDAARHSPNRKNIVFMALDTYLTDWSFLSANRVDVAVIDADHKYEKVRADAVNVLHTFPDVQWLVFDDYATEPADVKRAVDELIEEQVLVRCRPIGRGKDGRPWEMKGYKAYVIPEGMICARGPGSANKKAPFLDVTYLVYPVPGDPLVQATGIISFKTEGSKVWSSHFGEGSWMQPPGGEVRDTLFMRLLFLPPASDGVWEVLFNRGRSSFVLSPEGAVETKWFGVRADKIRQLFKIENERFEGFES